MSLRAALIVLFALPSVASAEWPADVEAALKKANANRPEVEKALKTAPPGQQKGMTFLVANMPDADLKSISAEFLLTNTELAYRARKETPWGKDIPEDIFLNDVLPYANVDEKRDPWRKEFFDLCMPMVKACKTPSEAAQVLNRELFKKINLKYSTERKAPNQSPKESIGQGKASCTGLSIVLSDACRAVCVPARLVGTPLWANKRGNHTWVEIWDKDWHFTGACEADPQGLNRGWFVGDAAQAKKDVFEHAIYATSFKKTPTHFPLVWAMRNKDVPAENVTDRYAKKPATATAKLLVKVIDANKKRVAVAVTATAGATKHEGTSSDETNDLNDILTFEVKPETEFVVKAGGVEKTVKVGKGGTQTLVDITIPAK
ncbi:MAG TPA: transglutaminase-like domain-containing protein [Gemmataceae bacterium]|nr:transglutaminase-like domain-containing protein [Gemmataceae bacterium]